MTRDEAQTAADELNEAHPERRKFRWLAREGTGGEWSVARIRLPHPAQRLSETEQGKQPTPPPMRPLDLPGGLPPWTAGSG